MNVFILEPNVELQKEIVRLFSKLKVKTTLETSFEEASKSIEVPAGFSFLVLDFEEISKGDMESIIFFDQKSETTPTLLLFDKRSTRQIKALRKLVNFKYYVQKPTNQKNLQVFRNVFLRILDKIDAPKNSPNKGKIPQSEEVERTTPTLESQTAITTRPSYRNIVLSMPDLGNTTIDKVSMPRVLFLLYYNRETGTLSIRFNDVVRTICFKNGNLLVPDQEKNDRMLKWLLATFAWTNGEIRFQSGMPKLRGFSEIRDFTEVLQQGIKRHISENVIARTMADKYNLFPVLTAYYINNVESYPIFESILTACRNLLEKRGIQPATEPKVMLGQAMNGMTPLSEFVSSFDFTKLNTLFAELYFAQIVDMFLLVETPFKGLVSHRYKLGQIGSEEEILKNLQLKLQEWEMMKPHEIFGLTPGCGPQRIKNSYMRMVKIYHPDVFARKNSKEIKATAQLLFFQIRDDYRELMEQEAKLERRAKLVEEAKESAAMSRPKSRKVAAAAPPSRTKKKISEILSEFTTQKEKKEKEPLIGDVGIEKSADTPEEGSEFDPQQCFRKGVQLLDKGKIKEAKQLFERARSSNEESATYHAHYAWAHFLEDEANVAEALKLLNAATKMKNGADDAFLLFGNVHLKLKQESKMLNCYSKALEINPGNRKARSLIRLYNKRKRKKDGLFGGLSSRKQK